ncbi:protein of unknown function DUF3850 [Flyfo myovirus Tbat2_7]|nr:protein of unknown function DUF3850 [Flyfo myovirus Tbat2_7]
MKIHELKLDIKYFKDVLNLKKTFEIRKNDRDFKVGDVLALSAYDNFYRRYSKNGNVTHRNQNDFCDLEEADTIFFDVTYITDYEQKDDYVVMSIVPSEKISKITGVI